MRHSFEDSCSMNVLNWKLYQKNNSVRTSSLGKVEFLSEVCHFCHQNLNMQVISNSKIFMYLLWLCRVLVFERKLCLYCSSCIIFNPTSHLNKHLFHGCVKLIGYFASVVNLVSSNPHVGSSPRIMMSYDFYYQYAHMTSYQL